MGDDPGQIIHRNLLERLKVLLGQKEREKGVEEETIEDRCLVDTLGSVISWSRLSKIVGDAFFRTVHEARNELMITFPF